MITLGRHNLHEIRRFAGKIATMSNQPGSLGVEREFFSRADLHCHSTASAIASLGVQNALGLPECATPPEEVYELAKRRGMDFVTITDHDTIDGALEPLGMISFRKWYSPEQMESVRAYVALKAKIAADRDARMAKKK